MASCRLRTRKNGTQFYEIRVYRGSEKGYLSTCWDVPSGWSAARIEKALGRFANDFEERVNSGEIISKKEQREKESEVKAELAKHKTVKQYIEEIYMPQKSVSFSENTRDSYQNNLEKHVIPVVGDVLIEEVTTQMLRDLLVDFQKSGKAHASCIKLYNILNSLFGYAETGGDIPINPVTKKIRPKASKEEEDEPESEKALDASALNYVLECVKKEPLKWQAYINVVADTGIRRGEACGIQWDDINFKKRSITIRRNVQYSKAKGVYVTTLKNRNIRTVDIGIGTKTLLEKLRAEQKNGSVWVFNKANSIDVMFPSTPTSYFKKFGDRYHIDNFHPHLLRHTSASIAITNGADIASVASRLGHKDTAVTLRMYTHANEESNRKAGQTVRDALQKEKKKSRRKNNRGEPKKPSGF